MREKDYTKLIEALNERTLDNFMIVPTFDESPYHEIKVMIPKELTGEIENVDLNIYFKEKANCRKKFTDKEGVKYITGYKQEGTHDKQED